MRKVDSVYTGDYARNYEATRLGSAQWDREQLAIEPMLRAIKAGDTVLDIAAGTGRWLPAYADIGARPKLLDVSQEMLDQAQSKARKLGLDISISIQSALDGPAFPQAKWAVITRFLNWIPLRSAQKVLDRCIEAGVENFLFMVTYLPDSLGPAETFKTRLAAIRKNTSSILGRREKGIYYLHSESALRTMLKEVGLAINVERAISDSKGRRNVMFCASTNGTPSIGPPLTIFDTCHLAGDYCFLNGHRYAVKKGSWAFYIPSLELKLLHAVDDCAHCVHRTAPSRTEVFSGAANVALDARYTLGDWANAFSKGTISRAAENFVAAKRLADAGLGPEPFGICVVQKFTADYSTAPCQTAGIFVKDVHRYRRKKEATVDDIVAAGVRPDRLLSCVRDQVRGYVIDLNSVVGVMPSAADALVGEIEKHVRVGVAP